MSHRWLELWQRRSIGSPQTGCVFNIAHRGARAFSPENTVESIDKAAELGADMVEIDVHCTGDGALVVVHDDDLLRCSDVKARFPDRASYFVSDFSFAEIQTLDAGTWYVAELEQVTMARQRFLQSLTDAERLAFISSRDLEI